MRCSHTTNKAVSFFIWREERTLNRYARRLLILFMHFNLLRITRVRRWCGARMPSRVVVCSNHKTHVNNSLCTICCWFCVSVLLHTTQWIYIVHNETSAAHSLASSRWNMISSPFSATNSRRTQSNRHCQCGLSMPALIGWIWCDKIKGRTNGGEKIDFCSELRRNHTCSNSHFTESHLVNSKSNTHKTVNCHYVWRRPFFPTTKQTQIWHIRRWCVKCRMFWALRQRVAHTCQKKIENIFRSKNFHQ